MATPAPVRSSTIPQLTVEALNIHLSPSSKKLTADTDVRSSIKPQKRKRGGLHRGRRSGMPSVMLKQDKPVNVTSNRLDYDGVAEATYSGNALLWQDNGRGSAADTIVLERSHRQPDGPRSRSARR